MEKYKPIIMFGIAIIVALITSVLIYDWLQKRAQVKEVVTLETHPVAVAVSDLEWGTVLTKEMIKFVPFLKDSIPPSSFSDISSLEGRVVIFPLKANEAVLESKLAPVSITTGGVAAVLNKDNRAMAVKVDKVIGVSGFIQPGSRVDVLVTLTKTGKTNIPVTKVILENILVLAAGTKIENKDKDKEAREVDVVTLEVSPEEGEKLALAATEGKIQLALRNLTDTEDVLTKGATIPSLLSSFQLKQNQENVKVDIKKRRTTRKQLPPQEPPTVSVELIKGNNVSTLKFKGGRISQ
jgi:pilus assembly protein CpaB